MSWFVLCLLLDANWEASYKEVVSEMSDEPDYDQSKLKNTKIAR